MANLALFLLLLLVAMHAAATYTHASTNLTARSPPQIPTAQRRGIPYNDVSLVSIFDKPGSLTTWRYNWDSSSSPSTAWFDFVPMLHSLRDDHTGHWKVNAEAVARGNYEGKNGRATWLLGFNEPDNCLRLTILCGPGAGGSCIDVDTAVAGWKKHVQPLASFNKNMYLGSPAVTNAAASDTSGLGWLAKFIEKCDGCTIDFVNIHWYGWPHADTFKSHIEATRKVARGRPIWVTEFQPTGSKDEIKRFLEEVLPWMDKSTDIHRYAYFMAAQGERMLLDGNGELSEVGKTYTFFRG